MIRLIRFISCVYCSDYCFESSGIVCTAIRHNGQNGYVIVIREIFEESEMNAEIPGLRMGKGLGVS